MIVLYSFPTLFLLLSNLCSDLGVSSMNSPIIEETFSSGIIDSDTQTVRADLRTYIKTQQQTLSFLSRCRSLKRPSRDLRVRGLSCLPQDQRLSSLSLVESLALSHAINNKRQHIKSLTDTMNSMSHDTLEALNKPCSSTINKNRKRLNKKFEFLSSLDKTEWTNWPDKGHKKQKKNVGQSIDNTSKKKSERKKISEAARRNRYKKKRHSKLLKI